jgi:hypothetical protein
MAKVIVQHHVEDYDRWYPVFVEHGQVRREYGATGHRVNRAADDPNNLIVVNDFATMEGARSFMNDPSLKEAMGRAGVNSEPQVWLADEADAQSY